jgi:3-deoxy-D-manno-octulosonic-acid transferase
MRLIYDFLVHISELLLHLIAPFHSKTALFVRGRKTVFDDLKRNLSSKDRVLWFHCASLGEFEQGRPLIEAVRKEWPNHKLVLTFFSPSGYEVRKKYPHADLVCYLPLDTRSKVRVFLELVQPSLAVFVKYEFWPNLLWSLKKRGIPTLLVSGIFRKEQVFFKKRGKWMRAMLRAFSHFFVQDVPSKNLLNSLGFDNVTCSGDTRFDRVYSLLNQNNALPFVTDFKQGAYVLVAGSTWKKDENLLVAYINQKATTDEKFIIAPHDIKPDSIRALKTSLSKKTVLYSEKEGNVLSDFQVLVLDTVGILTKVYSEASVAYVGGGFTKSGVHNVLEPSVFGIPVVIGPNHQKHREVGDLIDCEACISIADLEGLTKTLVDLRSHAELRKEKGKKALNYIHSNRGATDQILTYIRETLKDA